MPETLSSRALVTLAEARDWLNLAVSNTVEDEELTRVINDISDRMHQEAQREFKVAGTNPQTRLFAVDALGLRQGIVNVGDVTTITTVEVLDDNWTTVLETVTAANYQAWPMVRQPWEPIRQIRLNHRNGVRWLRAGYLVRVTGTFGFPLVPQSVRQAVLDAISATVDRDVEHYRTDLAGRAPDEGGTTIVVGGGRQRLLSMPPSALAVAWSYRDPMVG